MILPMLVVDKNINFSQLKRAEWLRRGIPTVQAVTMQEAIEELNKKKFLMVSINANNINYISLLKMVVDISSVPVIIMTSNFKVFDQTQAALNGAEGYTEFCEDINENIDYAMAILQRHNERDRKPKKRPEAEIYEDILVYPYFRQVFYNDIEISLTKTEFNLLYYLIINRGRVLTFRQIYRKIWGVEYQDLPHSILRNHIKKLQNKIYSITGRKYIENVRDVGYRFINNKR